MIPAAAAPLKLIPCQFITITQEKVLAALAATIRLSTMEIILLSMPARAMILSLMPETATTLSTVARAMIQLKTRLISRQSSAAQEMIRFWALKTIRLC